MGLDALAFYNPELNMRHVQSGMVQYFWWVVQLTVSHRAKQKCTNNHLELDLYL